MVISLSPLQGYTEYPFRNSLHKIIGGVDTYYTPFIRFENDGSIRKKHINDVLPDNNSGMKLVPQILVNNASHFLELANQIESLGYSEINWNLGCPYPMVAKRKLGSGLLAYPEIIEQILTEVLPKTTLDVSIKLRLGYLNNGEIDKVVDVLNKFPLKEVIIHPRIGKQLYKGQIDLEKFIIISSKINTKVCYNGDIDSASKFRWVKDQINDVNSFFIGRALISNPFLAAEIKGLTFTSAGKREKFSEFHKLLFEYYTEMLSGDSHLLSKFEHYWEYFSLLFQENRKAFKLIKKCKNKGQYYQASDEIIKYFTLV